MKGATANEQRALNKQAEKKAKKRLLFLCFLVVGFILFSLVIKKPIPGLILGVIFTILVPSLYSSLKKYYLGSEIYKISLQYENENLSSVYYLRIQPIDRPDNGCLYASLNDDFTICIAMVNQYKFIELENIRRGEFTKKYRMAS